MYQLLLVILSILLSLLAWIAGAIPNTTTHRLSRNMCKYGKFRRLTEKHALEKDTLKQEELKKEADKLRCELTREPDSTPFDKGLWDSMGVTRQVLVHMVYPFSRVTCPVQHNDLQRFVEMKDTDLPNGVDCP